MRLDEITSEKEKQKLDEILPALAVGAGMLARGAAAAGGAALRGGSALAKAAGSALSKGASSAGNAISKGASSAGNAISKAASSAGTAISKTASSAGKALGGTPATPTGAAAQAAQAAPSAAPGAMDIITALQDPKVAQQMKTMKQKMPDASLDAMVDPTADKEQHAQIQALDQALQALKKNAGLK